MEAVKANAALTTLELNDNQIGADAAKAIAKKLETNVTVQRLYMRANNIGEDGCKAMADMLLVNTTLEQLQMEKKCWRPGLKRGHADAAGDCHKRRLHIY